MLRFLFPVLVTTALAAGGSWDEVRKLKTGAELKIYQKGGKQPTAAIFDELGDESLIVVIKNEQVAIPRDRIDRIDARPARAGSRVTKETKVTKDETPTTRPSPRPSATGTPTSVSTSVSVQSKPDFETVYRRTAAAESR